MSLETGNPTITLAAPAPIRVLVVSPQSIVAWGLKQLLLAQASPRFVVDTARDGDAALALLRPGPKPDVTVLDLDPEPQQVISFIPALQANSSGRMLAITGARAKQAHDEAIMAGVHGVLEKEQPVELIVKAIEKVYLGQTWIDREAIGRITGALARRSTDHARTDRMASLTRRERDVVQRIMTAPGMPAKTLARELGISENTLNNHLASIYSKLEVSNRLELYASMQGRLDGAPASSRTVFAEAACAK